MWGLECLNCAHILVTHSGLRIHVYKEYGYGIRKWWPQYLYFAVTVHLSLVLFIPKRCSLKGVPHNVWDSMLSHDPYQQCVYHRSQEKHHHIAARDQRLCSPYKAQIYQTTQESIPHHHHHHHHPASSAFSACMFAYSVPVYSDPWLGSEGLSQANSFASSCPRS